MRSRRNSPIIQTADYPTIDEAIQNAILDHTSIQPRSAVLAIAGPVEGDEIDLTNCAWVVKPRTDDGNARPFATSPCSTISRRRRSPSSRSSRSIWKSSAAARRRSAWQPRRARTRHRPWRRRAWSVRATAGCRCPAKAATWTWGRATARDLELFPHIEHIEGRISGEQLLCGRGLQNIYRAICKVNGTPATLQTPAEITAAGTWRRRSARPKETLCAVRHLSRPAGRGLWL